MTRLIFPALVALLGFLAFATSWQNALAEDPNAILSKSDATQMFLLPFPKWRENVTQLKAAGVADLAVTNRGDYTMIMRPAPNAGLLMVTPEYQGSKKTQPWKLMVSIAADVEPSLSLFSAMSEKEVERLVKKAAADMAPDFTVMGYMARDGVKPPHMHYTIFKMGDFPPLDMFVAAGKVCPLLNGKPTCIRKRMIQ
jgi:hypothetical protein